MFTDECRFKLGSRGRVWVRRSQNERYNSGCTLSSSNDRRSLHFWGAIAYDGTVSLIKAPKKCNSLDNFHILAEGGVQFLQELVYKLVDDNAPIHRSHSVNEWKTRNGIQSVPWPVHSPDMNPIENVCAFMKTQLHSVRLVFTNLEQFATFGTNFHINWCQNCSSRCLYVMRNAFRTQASDKILI